MKFGDINVPKGVNVWTLMVSLHQDPDLWGPDANIFNPERFANGVSSACKVPYVYMPFGVGPRTCLGQNFAMAELKILLALIVSNFSFSLSPKYRHSPAVRLLIEPEHGVNLLIKKLWAMSQLSYYSWYCRKFSYLMMKLLIRSVLNNLCWNLVYDKGNKYVEVHAGDYAWPAVLGTSLTT